MKKLSEVVKITGLSRRALQGYDKMGLLSPSAKTEGGYWLYDDEAIRKLVIIKLFTESGYTREQTKTLLSSSNLEISDEYDKLIGSLMDEKRLIEGKIRAIRLFKLESRLSKTTRSALLSIDPKSIYQETSFADCLSRLFHGSAAIAGEIDVRETELYTLLWFCFIAIGLLVDAKKDNDALVSAGEAHGRFFDLIGSFDPDWMSQASRDDTVFLFGKFTDIFLKDEQISKAIEQICGYNAAFSISDVIARWVSREIGKSHSLKTKRSVVENDGR